tara:strand:- start:1051 stop:1317 length:267 start_codon:yes stop_codon:yes gene_type:complete
MIVVEKKIGQLVPLSKTVEAISHCNQLEKAITRMGDAIGASEAARARLCLLWHDLDQATWYNLSARQRAIRLADYASVAILKTVKGQE